MRDLPTMLTDDSLGSMSAMFTLDEGLMSKVNEQLHKSKRTKKKKNPKPNQTKQNPGKQIIK